MVKDRDGLDHSRRSRREMMRTFAGTGGLAILASILGPAASPEFVAIASGQARPSPGVLIRSELTAAL